MVALTDDTKPSNNFGFVEDSKKLSSRLVMPNLNSSPILTTARTCEESRGLKSMLRGNPR